MLAGATCDARRRQGTPNFGRDSRGHSPETRGSPGAWPSATAACLVQVPRAVVSWKMGRGRRLARFENFRASFPFPLRRRLGDGCGCVAGAWRTLPVVCVPVKISCRAIPIRGVAKGCSSYCSREPGTVRLAHGELSYCSEIRQHQDRSTIRAHHGHWLFPPPDRNRGGLAPTDRSTMPLKRQMKAAEMD